MVKPVKLVKNDHRFPSVRGFSPFGKGMERVGEQQNLGLPPTGSAFQAAGTVISCIAV